METSVPAPAAGCPLQLERDESEQTVAHYTIGAGLEAMRRETSSFYHYNHRRSSEIRLTEVTRCA
jgi:hypothetical protein